MSCTSLVVSRNSLIPKQPYGKSDLEKLDWITPKYLVHLQGLFVSENLHIHSFIWNHHHITWNTSSIGHWPKVSQSDRSNNGLLRYIKSHVFVYLYLECAFGSRMLLWNVSFDWRDFKEMQVTKSNFYVCRGLYLTDVIVSMIYILYVLSI